MDIEWDPRKAAENLRKHGVDFADAAIALEDENALTIEDKDHDEQRFKTLGMGPTLNILYVIHADRTNCGYPHYFSPKADRSETEAYYRGLNYE